MPKRYNLVPQRCMNDDDDLDEPSGEKRIQALSGQSMAPKGIIWAMGVLEMKYNMFWACCRGRSDATWHNAGLR